jgi:hypothetical protein
MSEQTVAWQIPPPLLIDVVNNSHIILPNDKMTVNNEMERLWQVSFVA